MWRRRPDRDLVDGWIDRALELAGPETPARARALIARCVWAPLGSAEEAREASALAERLDDPELRSYAWDARAITLWVSGEQDLGRALEERRFELIDQIHDPDHVADIHYAPVSGCIWLGYFEEARRLARRHDEITSVLTPHHRIHGVAVLVEVEELAGAGSRFGGSKRERRRRSSATWRRPACAALARCSCARLQRPSSAIMPAPPSSKPPRTSSAWRATAMCSTRRGCGWRCCAATWSRRSESSPIRSRTAVGTAPGSSSRRTPPGSTRSPGSGTGGARVVGPAPRRHVLEPFYLRALGVVREDEQLLERSLAAFEALRLPGTRRHPCRARLI
jgi:hypothetical protein